MASGLTFRSLQCQTSGLLTRKCHAVPFVCTSRRIVKVRAEGAESTASAELKTADGKVILFGKPIQALTWDQDTESIKDVFAFAGSAPERTNGRVAMISFALIVASEFSSKQPALEQLSNNWGTALFLSLLLTVATITPKLVAGTSLAELHKSATTKGLAGPNGEVAALGIFDESYELWLGRIAMLGLVGLGVVEAIKGDAFFG